MHFVHHASGCYDNGAPVWFRAKNRIVRMVARRRERRALIAARLVIVNSHRTRADLLSHIPIDPNRIHVVYLGSDPSWIPPSLSERAQARATLNTRADHPLAVFVGALGYDQRKGFDTLLEAWSILCRRPEWDVDLLAVGAGRGIETWRKRVRDTGLDARVQLPGFTEDVRSVLAAADILVSPVRYESYGLNVQEAVCRGVPTLVSAQAGVAEQYPPDLAGMLLHNPEDVGDLVEKLLRWRAEMEHWRRMFLPLSAKLRAYSWSDMGRRMLSVIESGGASPD